MGLGQILSRRHRPGEGCGRACGREDAVLGGDGSSMRSGFHCREILERTCRVSLDARPAARHEDPSLGDVHGWFEIKKPPSFPGRAAITGGTECYWVPIPSTARLAARLRLFVDTFGITSATQMRDFLSAFPDANLAQRKSIEKSRFQVDQIGCPSLNVIFWPPATLK